MQRNKAVLTLSGEGSAKSAEPVELQLSAIRPDKTNCDLSILHTVFEYEKYSVSLELNREAFCFDVERARELEAQKSENMQDRQYFEDDMLPNQSDTDESDKILSSIFCNRVPEDAVTLNELVADADDHDPEEPRVRTKILPPDVSWKKLNISFAVDGELLGYHSYTDESSDSDSMRCGFYVINKTPSSQGHGRKHEMQNTGRIFRMHYDLVVLSFTLTLRDSRDTQLTLYSEPLVCTTRGADLENINKIMANLTDLENNDLLNLMFRNRMKQGYDLFCAENKTCSSLLQYTKLIEDICACYSKNFAYFSRLAGHRLKKRSVIMPFNQVKQITTSDVIWLTRNMDTLCKATRPGAGSIMIDNTCYTPLNMQSDITVKSFDTAENIALQGFLLRVINHVRHILLEYRELVEKRMLRFEGGGADAELGNSPLVKWQLSTLNTVELYLNRLSGVLNTICNLYTRYKLALKLPDTILNTIPYKSKTFRELRPYAEIYAAMMRFFNEGNLKPDKDRMQLRLKTMDKVFEYYCLYTILDMLTDHGFTPADNASRYFRYTNNVLMHKDPEDVANTFVFERGATRITVYYQPIIYSNMFENGLRLFRTSVNNNAYNFYTPDFVLKIMADESCRDNEDYVVFDSKFSSAGSINRNYMQDLIIKYSTQMTVACFKNIEGSEGMDSPTKFVEEHFTGCKSIKMLLALQGRIEKDQNLRGGVGFSRLSLYHNSNLSRLMPPPVTYGILQMNTGFDSKKELWQALQKSMPYLKSEEEQEESRAKDESERIAKSAS